MKTSIWKLICGLTLVFVFLAGQQSVLAQGQRGGNMEERMKARVDAVVKELAITGDKETKVREILDTQGKAQMELMQAFRGQDRNSRKMMREELETLREETTEKLATVLSDEEMEKYKKMQEEMAQRRRGGRQGQQGQGIN